MGRRKTDGAALPPYCRAIRTAAEAGGLTVKALAAKSGVSHGTVVKVWSGSTRVLLDHILKVAGAVGVTLTLSPGESPPPPAFKPVKIVSVQQGLVITLGVEAV